MDERVESKDKYTVLERVFVITDDGDCIAADALGAICKGLATTDDDKAGEQWVATTVNDSIVFERRLWL